MPAFTPMLAAAANDLRSLRFPMLVSPKLDGMRVAITEKGPVTRNGGRLPNEAIARYLDDPRLYGLDGELIWGDPVAPDVVQRSIAAGMARLGPPPEAGLSFYVFDSFARPQEPFTTRWADALEAVAAAELAHVQPVLQVDVADLAELARIEARIVATGFEGVVMRRPDAPYIFGRTTPASGVMLKFKRRTEDVGAIVALKPDMLVVAHPTWPQAFDVPLHGKKLQGELLGRRVRFSRHPGSWKAAPRSPLFVALEPEE